MKDPEPIRKSYHLGELRKEDLPPDPITLFKQWWDAAVEADIPEPNAMTLSTVDSSGHPSARIVLLKGISGQGFEFFTNYQSRKALDMERQAHVALVFFWKELERQIRIEGEAEKVSRQRSQEYFQSRPLGSQIGAWASPQSKVIQDRSVLADAVLRIEEKFKGQSPLPVPDHWGGYLVKPHRLEFWQGRPDRLHDRFEYVLENKVWKIQRLAP